MVSDRNRKEAFLPVDGEDVLARVLRLLITSWRYIAEEDRAVRHIGPMAQDWRAAFGFSGDSTTINSGDMDGVSLAAAQALAARTAALGAEDTALRGRIGALEAERARMRDDIDAARQENEALRAALRETAARLDRLERSLPRPR